MKTSDFDYRLPPELIAQEPLKERDTSRLLCLDRESGVIDHRTFSDLPDLIRPGDRLVFNNTKVFPARLYCKKDTGGRVELFFLHKNDDYTWKTLARSSRPIKEGAVVALEGDSSIKLSIDKILHDGSRIVSIKEGSVDLLEEMLEKYGEMPLPPYIKRHVREDDRAAYQTVYAEEKGAVAAPTAGLHFTRELMQQVSKRDVNFSFVTLHVGVGTFRPVKEEDPRDHVMHSEQYILNEKTADDINTTKREGGRNIAIGTTTVRVLEHCAFPDGYLRKHAGSTRLKILPGYNFKVVDGLITNFHLPRSTLLMLVSAFTGRGLVLAAYNEAIKLKYRFYSYGDAMMIL